MLVYQSLLGIYGDRGNATVLARRLAWRGFDAVLTVVEPGEPLPDTGHVYLLGGGEDAAQISAVRALQADGGLHRAVDRGAVVFAVCAGYQIVGRTFTVGDPTVPGGEDQVIEGLGLLDVTTTRGPRRAVGEILSRWRGRDGEDDRRCSPASRTTAAGPASARTRSRWPTSRSGSATATTAPRARWPARWSPPTPTGRCSPATRRWPTTC